MSDRRRVPRALRLVNLLAGLLFVAGAGVYIRAWLGMRELERHPPGPEAELFAGMARFDHFWVLSRIGVWLVGSALLVAVLAAIAAAVLRRRQPAVR